MVSKVPTPTGDVKAIAPTCSEPPFQRGIRRARFEPADARSPAWRGSAGKATAGGVPVGRLEVVEQRPDEIPADVDPAVDRGVNGPDVGAQVVDPERIG